MFSKLEKYKDAQYVERVEEIFLKIQKAWDEDKLEELINIQSAIMLERDFAKMQRYKKENKKVVRKSVVINYVRPIYYQETEDKEILKYEIKASMESYVYDMFTEEVYEGIREYKDTNIYVLTFVKTNDIDKKTILKCEGCGAPIKAVEVGKCEYCGNVVIVSEHSWLVENIEITEEKNYIDDNDNRIQ